MGHGPKERCTGHEKATPHRSKRSVDDETKEFLKWCEEQAALLEEAEQAAWEAYSSDEKGGLLN